MCSSYATHNPRGEAALVIELGQSGAWQLFSSRFAFAEARRNLERKSREQVPRWVRFQQGIRRAGPRPASPPPDGLPRVDIPIFQAALACRAAHLLTGDLKDFGPFMNRPEGTFGITVQTVADFLRAS